MALIVDPYTANAGAVIAAAEINARIAAILAQVNGNLDAANIKDATVSKSKLASDALQAFLQLNSPATKKVSFGSASSPSWGNSDHVDVTLAPGFNPTHVFVICGTIDTFSPSVTGDVVVPSIISLGTTTTVRLRANAAGSSNNSCSFYWIAFG